MSDEIVPQDDLPDEAVPEHDLPDQPGTYDPRKLVPLSIAAGVGAPIGAISHSAAQLGINEVKKGRLTPPSKISSPHPSEVVPGHTPYRPTGVSVEDSLSNWKSYNEAQLEASKKVRQESALHKKYPGFTRAGPQLEIPQLPANATYAQKAGAKLWPGAASDVANFAKGVSEYKLPIVGQVGPLAGHLLGGAATAMQGTDAYNRTQQDDTTGAVISGIGAAGTGVSTLPFPAPARAIGAGVGLSAEAINAYRDAIRRGQIVHGAPESYENTTPMGDQYAQGGLVHLAGGGQPNVQQIQSNISPQEQAIIDYHRNTIASGNVGRDEHGNPVTVYSSTVNIPSGPHAGKVATVPGYYNNQIHNNPQEIQSHWADQINQGKWPIYYDPRTGDTRAKYIHGVMDQEPNK